MLGADPADVIISAEAGIVVQMAGLLDERVPLVFQICSGVEYR
jgi:hypothetical protein